VGDAYDNGLAESFVDSFKTELMTDRVWRTRTQLELAIVEYVGWFNHARLHQSLGDMPPSEFEVKELSARTEQRAGYAGINIEIEPKKPPNPVSVEPSPAQL
jgi:hypothetical protein